MKVRKIWEKIIQNKNELFLSFLSHQERLGFVSWRSGASFCSEDFYFPKSLGGENWVVLVGDGSQDLDRVRLSCQAWRSLALEAGEKGMAGAS